MLNLLQQLEQQGVIRALDYQFARLMHSMSPDPLVTLLAANVSHELGLGNVCMSLNGKLFGLDSDASQPLLNRAGIAREHWQQQLSTSQLVADGSQPTPLVLDDGRLYLYRYWQYECNVARFLKRQRSEKLDQQQARTILQRLFQRDYSFVAQQCAGQSPAQQQATIIKWLDIETPQSLDWPAILTAFQQIPDAGVLDRLIPDSACLNWQKIAAAVAVSRSFSVISGGPGTGKTTTVTRLLALLTELAQQQGSAPTIKLVAPTGKAAARLTESIGGALARINCHESVREKIPTQAGTLHRLLGVLPGKSGFIHNQNNRLHLDILVVDEASMIDLPLMSQLLAALPDHARLILLGDRDQLSSVEAGSVLGDICLAAASGYSAQQVNLLETLTDHPIHSSARSAADHRVSDSLCLLRKSYRFDAQSGIGSLAKAVNGEDLKTLASLFSGDFTDIALLPVAESSDYQRLIQHCVEQYRPYLTLVQQQATPEAILNAFNQFQLLCALREGAFGITGLNDAIEKALQQQGLVDATSQWYEGRPVLITRNDHGLGLYNGDIGMTVLDSNGRLKVAFQLPDKQLKLFLPSRLPEHETVFAMTIHKSQGSEFLRVAMVLPDKDNPIITRELVYTGITRAKSTLNIFSGMDMLVKAAKSPTQRESGLYHRLLSA